jgi:hypothetical protein
MTILTILGWLWAIAMSERQQFFLLVFLQAALFAIDELFDKGMRRVPVFVSGFGVGEYSISSFWRGVVWRYIGVEQT